MSVTQALSVYREVGYSIFGHKQRRTLGGINVLATRFDHENVENAVKRITKQYCREHEPGTCPANDTLLWTDMSGQGINNARDLCQAVLITARAKGKHSQALPLRTYHYEHHPSLPSRDPNYGVEDLDLMIWEAARATSAAPFYFKMYEKRDSTGRLRRYKDGGTLLNNPAQKALSEVRDRDGLNEKGQRNEPALLLSVGTGIRYDTPFAAIKSGEYARSRRADLSFIQSIKERLAIAKHILMRYTEGEVVHRTIRDNVGAEHLWYKRLNVDQGLGDMDLGDWQRGNWHDMPHSGGATLTRIEDATNAYLGREVLHTNDEIEWFLLPSELIDHTAERLVRHRIERRKLASNDTVQPSGAIPDTTELGSTSRKLLEQRWQTHQGRYVSGRRTDPWDNNRHDLPKSPASSRENLKPEGSRSTT